MQSSGFVPAVRVMAELFAQLCIRKFSDYISQPLKEVEAWATLFRIRNIRFNVCCCPGFHIFTLLTMSCWLPNCAFVCITAVCPLPGGQTGRDGDNLRDRSSRLVDRPGIAETDNTNKATGACRSTRGSARFRRRRHRPTTRHAGGPW